MRGQIIRLLAVILLGMSLSVQASISLPLQDGSTVELYDKSYALLIGVSDYEDWPDLPGVEDDIEAVGNGLKKHGFKVISLLNPTRNSFDATMRDFIGDYGQDPENRLIIYYAGHGYTLTTNRGRELGYIVPSDAPLPKDGTGAFKKKAISMLEIEIFAKQMESKHAMFTFDSCFSGSLFEITRAVPDTISLKTSEPVRQFITAGSAEQTVPDKSVFRNQFVAGLEGEADVNKDGFITGTELAQYIEESVTNYTRRAQTPQYGKIRDPYLDKGDFVFINPKMEIIINVPGKETAKTVEPQKVDPRAVELSYWDAIKNTQDPEAYQAYLDEYPDGQFSKLATLLIKQAGKQEERNRALKLEREEEKRQQVQQRASREEEFKRQQALLAEQQRDTEQRMAAFKAEQAQLAAQREAEEARLKELLAQQKLAMEQQQALDKSQLQVASITPSSEVTAQKKKIAVVTRGEAKFGWSLSEEKFTQLIAKTYKRVAERMLPSGSSVSIISESSNNYNIAYDDEGGPEVKRVCQEQSVDGVLVGFIENVSETQWPSYYVSFVNCIAGTSVSNSYSLDKHKDDKYRFERSVKRGLKDFWRYSVAAEFK